MSKAYFKDLEGREKDDAEADLQTLISALIGKKEEAKKIDNSSMIQLSGIFDNIVPKGNPKHANSKPSSFETHSKEKISKMKKTVKTINKHSAEDDAKKVLLRKAMVMLLTS